MADSSPTHRSVHAVLFPLPAQGHLNPMMQLAKILASRGIQISFVTSEYIVSRILEAKDSGSALSDVANIRLIGVPDGLPDDCNRDIMGPYLAQALQNMSSVFEALLQELQAEEQPLTCVIGDCYVKRVKEVARKLNIPRLVFWPQSVTAFTLCYHSKEMISGSFNPFDGLVKPFGPKQPFDLITCVPGVAPIHPAYLPFETSLGLSGLSWLKNWIEEQLRNNDDEIRVIGNSFHNLEPQACEGLPMKFQPIGPLLLPAFLQDGKFHDRRSGTSLWKEDEDCMDWLDKQRESSVLYVSFGSLIRFSIAQIQEIACGLIASGQHFLWVIRPGTVLESVSNVWEALPGGFLDQVEGKGMIIKWAPQAQVLAHASVSGFFSHCGWNSTLESICMGVPLLCWPQIFDQLTNCWLVVHEWKVGLELERDGENKTDRRLVEKAVRLLMESQASEEMRARAAILRDEAIRTWKPDGGSSRGLELLVEDVLNLLETKSLHL